jgi:hypothetical protein
MLRILKPRWLFHIDIFIEKSVQEGILNINLPKTPITRDCQRQQRSYSCGFDDWTEGVIIVHTILLFESLANDPDLEMIYRPIRFMLQLGSPFRLNDIKAGRMRNKMPRLVFN